MAMLHLLDDLQIGGDAGDKCDAALSEPTSPAVSGKAQ
jgi:hypothetical protein